MTDESQSDARPLEALRREVEPPRTAASLWLPLMALASAAMLTIVSGVAVMTRAPRAVMVAPADAPPPAPEMAPTVKPNVPSQAEVDRIIEDARRSSAESAKWRAENLEEMHVPCNAPVVRADLDGRPQPFQECLTYRRKTAP